MPFYGYVDIASYCGVKCLKRPHFGTEIGIFKLKMQDIQTSVRSKLLQQFQQKKLHNDIYRVRQKQSLRKNSLSQL